MAMCEWSATCPFYNGRMAQAVPAVVESMKQRYCHGNQAQCARYMVRQALGVAKVPVDLAPNQTPEAIQLIQGKAG